MSQITRQFEHLSEDGDTVHKAEATYTEYESDQLGAGYALSMFTCTCRPLPSNKSWQSHYSACPGLDLAKSEEKRLS